MNKTTEDTFTSIDTVALADVTGGCAACGQNCANGPAPQQAAQNKSASPFNPFARR